MNSPGHAKNILDPNLTRLGVGVQTGADGLEDDPMSKLALSNRALWRAVVQTTSLAPRRLVVGGQARALQPQGQGHSFPNQKRIVCPLS